MLWSDDAGAPCGGLSHGVGDRRTLHNSCDSLTRCATAREGCDATAIHSSRHTDGEPTPGPPRATQTRADHHSAPDPICVPLAPPARAPGGDECRTDAADHRCATPIRIQTDLSLPTAFEDTF